MRRKPVISCPAPLQRIMITFRVYGIGRVLFVCSFFINGSKTDSGKNQTKLNAAAKAVLFFENHYAYLQQRT